MMFSMLLGFSDWVPDFRDSFGTELQSNCAGPLLYEAEPHQLRFQYHHHEPACGGCVGESRPAINRDLLLSNTVQPENW